MLMNKYYIRLYRWPYSGITIKGNKEIGIEYSGYNFEDAYTYANHVLEGIRHDERVWTCGIIEILKQKE